jgi:hypothetical protein
VQKKGSACREIIEATAAHGQTIRNGRTRKPAVFR